MTKTINGETYQKIKGHAGKVWWVHMSPTEILERRLYNITMVAAPLLTILVWSLAAGLLG